MYHIGVEAFAKAIISEHRLEGGEGKKISTFTPSKTLEQIESEDILGITTVKTSVPSAIRKAPKNENVIIVLSDQPER